MATLANFPEIVIPPAELLPFGQKWIENGQKLKRSKPYSSLQLGSVFDSKVGAGLAAMLGGINVVRPHSKSLLPAEADCVEVGPCRIVGGIRPQNFDVGYRPDGVRFAFDSKTLNDKKSIGKNYQNMINDLATESSTVHTRFPSAIVALFVAIPSPCLMDLQQAALISTLERLTGRRDITSHNHRAEAICFLVWNPDTGQTLTDIPPTNSNLRIEIFGQQIQSVYYERFQGMPPHNAGEDDDEEEEAV